MSAPTLEQRLARLNVIGTALSAERNLNRLLELIVDEARAFTRADGGTLYLVDGHTLRFAIVQTTSLGVRMGGTSGQPITWPLIPLRVNEQPNLENVSAYVAITGQTVNIPDVYNTPGFNFERTKVFDANTGYRSQSMLVVPLRDHEAQIIGVLQLINAGNVASFSPEDQALVESLASQAAVALNNVRLIKDTEELFEAFVRVMAAAIDEQSPSTSGHVKRVASITLALAQAINATQAGTYGPIAFDDDELKELRIASWMHDVGKVTTPVHIVEKHTKLETVTDRIETIRVRFALLHAQIINRSLQPDAAGNKNIPIAENQLENELASLDADLAFIEACNTPTEFMPAECVERIKCIAQRTYVLNGQEKPLLEPEEVACLCVQRGNLTTSEMDIMREHAAVTNRLLAQIPFTRKLSHVPLIAGAHHEKLNGKGYPKGLAQDQIPIQARMLTIADVYDALTATDRSYKKARTPEEALRILGFMAKDGEVDGDLLQIFSAMIHASLPSCKEQAG